MASVNSSNVTYRPDLLVYYTSTGSVQSVTQTVFIASTDTLVKVASVTPSWKSLVKRGFRIKPLAYSISKSLKRGFIDADATDCGSEQQFQTRTVAFNPYPIAVRQRFLMRSNTAKSYWRCSDKMSPPLLEPYVSQVNAIANRKLLLKIKDSKVNLVQAYAESGQVQRLVGDTTRKLASVLVHLRKGQLLAAGSVLGLRVGKREAARYTKLSQRAGDRAAVDNMMSSGVLSLQYGIRPLISDIIGAAELFAQKVSEEVVASASAKHRQTFDFSRSKSERGTYNAYEEWTVRATCFSKMEVDVKVGCTFAKGSETVHTLSQMGITNPLVIAWELCPWSFVIDWFIPIGNWLSSLDATFGLEFKTGYVSTKVSIMHTRSQAVSGGVESNSSSSYSTESFTRVPLTAFPSTSRPAFKNPLSLEHALNGIALLIGVKNKVISGGRFNGVD